MDKENNIKLKLDAISKQIDMIKTKLLIFSAGVGACWAFIIKDSTNFNLLLLAIVIILLFIFSFGVIINLMKYGKMDLKIKEILQELENE